MRGFKLKFWVNLFLFALGVHVVYLAFILVGAGSLATKKGMEIVLTALNMPGVAKVLTPSVLDMALEETVAYNVELQKQEARILERRLAAEEPPMPEMYQKFKGRGLLSDDEVIDVAAIEAQIKSMEFGIIPDAVEFPQEIPQQGTPQDGGTQ